MRNAGCGVLRHLSNDDVVAAVFARRRQDAVVQQPRHRLDVDAVDGGHDRKRTFECQSSAFDRDRWGHRYVVSNYVLAALSAGGICSMSALIRDGVEQEGSSSSSSAAAAAAASVRPATLGGTDP